MYETWCLKCERTEEEKIREEEQDEKIQKQKIRQIKRYMYVGETARSGYERGLEHLRDFQEMKLDSHMLKHYVEIHEGEKMETIEFGMRIVKEARSAFERQIAESFHIQNQKKNNIILNSKSEYNSCALPRLTAKIGNFSMDELDRKKGEEKEKEKEWAKKVRNLKVTRSKARRENHLYTTMPAEKKRRMDITRYMRVLQGDEKQEKRKDHEDLAEQPKEKQKKRRTEVDKVEIDENPNLETEISGEENTTEEDESKWEDEEDIKRYWKTMLEEREARILGEEQERERKLRKAEKLEKS